jgi:lipopolysaccharide/colanic/teichoic acid biosynthesis glycosyltransferase
VATSERILTVVPNAADRQPHVARRSLNVSYRPVWRQPVIDFVLISLSLVAIPASFGYGIGASAPHALWLMQPLPPYVLALMVTTVFAFAGAYPRRRTPLDISDTEGLMRSIACTLVLLAIGSLGSNIRPDYRALLTIGFIVALLVIQRELAHLLGRRKPVALLYSAEVSFTDIESGISGSDTEYVTSFEVSCGVSPASYLLKRTVDLCLAVIALVLVAPLFLMVAALIKMDTRGPVLIRQRRIGRKGVPFFMWKFRSMHAGVERYAHSPVSDADPRLTRFGRSLRRLSIDELPQLFNVLTGDMSLVGPRPEMPFIVNKYAPHERLRLNAIPGITGLWQISPARAMPIHQHLELDLFYIEHRNIFLDLAILLRTVTAVIRGIGAT